MPSQLHDLASGAALLPAQAPLSITANGETGAVDMQNTDGPCFAIQVAGQVASSTLHGRFRESDNGGDWFDIPGGAFMDVAGGDNLQILTFARSRRYVKYVYSFNDGESGTALIVAMIGAQKKIVS